MQKASKMPTAGRSDPSPRPVRLNTRSGIAYVATVAELLLIVAVACTAFAVIGAVMLPGKSKSPATATAALGAIKKLYATTDGRIWFRRGSAEIVAFNPESQTSTSPFSWNGRPVSRFHVSDDGTTVVMTLEERDIMIFRNEQFIVSEEMAPLQPAKTALSGDGQVAVRWSESAGFRCWDLSTTEPTIRELLHDEPADRISLDQHGTRLFVASTMGNLQIYDLTTSLLIQTISGVGQLSAPVQSTKDGQNIVTLCGRTISLYDAPSGKLIWQTTPQGTEDLYDLVICPEDRWIAVSGIASPIYLIDCATGKVMHYCYHPQNFCGISFSSKGETLFSGRRDGLICVWSLQSDRFSQTVIDPHL